MSIRENSRKLGALLAAGVMCVLLSIGVAAPAQAATSNCPLGATCVWKDHTYRTNGLEGGLVGFQQCVHNYALLKYAGTTIAAGTSSNGSSLSVYNHSSAGNSVTMYQNTLYTGSSFTLVAGDGDGNISNAAGTIQGVTWKPLSGKFAPFGTSCRN